MRIINTLRQHPGGVTLDRYTYQPRRYREGFAVSLTDCAFNDLTAANVTRSLSTIRRTARALHLKQYAVGYWADGGRGYFTIEPKVKTLRQVADGWVTGYPDETVAHKNLAIELKKTLEEFDRVPFTLFWVLAPTSNVFSQASTLYVPKKEYDQYKTWLRSVLNVSPDDVEGAFN